MWAAHLGAKAFVGVALSPYRLTMRSMPPSKLFLPVTADPFPDLPIERGPKNKGVGIWVPQDKHRLLCDYLHTSRHAWKKWPQRIFLDPFCGPGRIQVEGESFTRDGGAVLAWRALSETAPFTQMLVGDLDPGRAEACGRRLAAHGATVRTFAGPAEDTIREMIPLVPRNALCIAYIDPYNLELLSFSIIKALAGLKVDLAINFSTDTPNQTLGGQTRDLKNSGRRSARFVSTW